jgi:cysteine sulfinate desulfinase/cysteine desulfurase-like protein
MPWSGRVLERHGFSVKRAPVGSDGRIRAAGIEALVGAQTALVTVMHAHTLSGAGRPLQQRSRYP